MSNRQWSERVEDELARRGVPAEARQRLMAEWRDHADDISQGEGLTMTDDVMTARMGVPAELAAAAAEGHRRSRWASRYPLVAFGLLPLPLTVLAFAATWLVIGLTAWAVALAYGGDMPRRAMVAFAYAAVWGVRFVPFALMAVMFTRAYLLCRVSPWWFALAAVQILAVAGSMVSSLHLSDVPGQSHFDFGFAWMPVPVGGGWVLPFLNFVGWMQLAQVAVPVAVEALVVRAARRREAVLSVA